ncbi:MAG: NUDIX hydrolase [Armatimonadia bacterium]
MSDLMKAHIKGYSKKDGTYVKPHERDTGATPHMENTQVHHHPRVGENGQPVIIKHPSHASSHSTWHNPDAVATFVPDGDVPLSINGVPFRAWKDHPRTVEGWDYVEGVNDDLWEPAFHLPPGKKAASGVVIEEPDGRVWLISPTNQFGGYECTFPKGTAEEGLSLQANAIKECFEETGLKVEIIDVIGDFERTTSVARLYRARRVGGTPSAMGWETQAAHLVPKGMLYEHLNMWPDHGIAEEIGAGPAPNPSKPEVKSSNQKGLF